uniref:Putative secreted protein n=1 Tax=Anopheles darlingi TaxID=43151 RepID=A0A2M4DLG5_ANODA
MQRATCTCILLSSICSSSSRSPLMSYLSPKFVSLSEICFSSGSARSGHFSIVAVFSPAMISSISASMV